MGREPIRPGHIAVLVRTHRTAALVRDALEAVAIPAVINGAGSVFATEPAREWLRLLEALERPTSPPRARSTALTPYLGWTVEALASAGEDDFEDLHRLHAWAPVLRVRGVASLLEAITLAEGLPARVVRTVDGECRLTDLRHVGQLLHAARDKRADGHPGDDLVAAQRIDQAQVETARRGAKPPAQVGRRGGRGPHHPSQ